MKKIYLTIGVHNHQPVGNFDFVFEDAYQKAYDPFLHLIEQFPQIKITQHYSGILLQWIAAHHPEFITRLGALAGRGQIELMSGGFYEPILIAIPDEDKIAQIRKLTHYIEANLYTHPEGAWLAERVWEPELPHALVQAGISYSVVDDVHFKFAGLRDEQLYGYYLTEHLGALMRIFPISERLRYTIPFRPPEETIEYLHSLATEEGDRIAVFADDGEKFGVWPETYAQCYESGWLHAFFSLLQDNQDWLQVVTFQEALQKLTPLGRIYLPAASYREMMEWSMPAQTIIKYDECSKWLADHHLPVEYKSFIHGGFWRNFLAKYPEANSMHKRMLRTSQRLRAWQGEETPQLAAAREHLYASQCNCPYWHGVFGGLYLPNLRYPIYQNLIQADCAMDQAGKTAAQLKKGWVTADVIDFDADAQDELIIESDRMSLYFAPGNGGALFEWDIKHKAVNLLDTMTRREEGYHHRLRHARTVLDQTRSTMESTSISDLATAKEENLQRYLHYDWYRRSALIDHFLHPSTQLEQFARAKYGEQGDFVDQPYAFDIAENATVAIITLEREGHVWMGPHFVPIQLRKQISIRCRSTVVEVDYTVINRHAQTVDLWFASESAFALLAGDAKDRYFISPDCKVLPRNLASTGVLENIQTLGMRDEWNGLEVQVAVDRPATFWRFPIETVSLSEAGFERIYQCSVVMPHWRIRLQPEEMWRMKLLLSCSDC